MLLLTTEFPSPNSICVARHDRVIFIIFVESCSVHVRSGAVQRPAVPALRHITGMLSKRPLLPVCWWCVCRKNCQKINQQKYCISVDRCWLRNVSVSGGKHVLNKCRELDLSLWCFVAVSSNLKFQHRTTLVIRRAISANIRIFCARTHKAEKTRSVYSL